MATCRRSGCHHGACRRRRGDPRPTSRLPPVEGLEPRAAGPSSPHQLLPGREGARTPAQALPRPAAVAGHDDVCLGEVVGHRARGGHVREEVGQHHAEQAAVPEQGDVGGGEPGRVVPRGRARSVPRGRRSSRRPRRGASRSPAGAGPRGRRRTRARTRRRSVRRTGRRRTRGAPPRCSTAPTAVRRRSSSADCRARGRGWRRSGEGLPAPAARRGHAPAAGCGRTAGPSPRFGGHAGSSGLALPVPDRAEPHARPPPSRRAAPAASTSPIPLPGSAESQEACSSGPRGHGGVTCASAQRRGTRGRWLEGQTSSTVGPEREQRSCPSSDSPPSRRPLSSRCPC